MRGGTATYQAIYQAFARYGEGLGAPLRLCGLSLGGILALQYAAEHPERVRALALIGTQFVMPKGLLKLQNGIFRLMPNGVFRQMGLPKGDVIDLTNSMLDLDFREALGQVAAFLSLRIRARGKTRPGAAMLICVACRNGVRPV